MVDPPGADARLAYAAYELLTTLAERQLSLGQSAIPDSVAGFARLRRQWNDLAKRHQASWRPIECVCSDEPAHRARLLHRQRGIASWYELTWNDIERVRSSYEP